MSSGTRRSTILKRRSALSERLIIFVKRFGVVLAVLAFLAWGAAWFVLSGAMTRAVETTRESFFQKTASWGFFIENVLVDGRHYTDIDAIRAVLNVQKGDSIFSFYPAEAKARLEKDISWIKAAQVERRLPNTLYVKLIERTPMALWQQEGRLALIDEYGVVLTHQNLGPFRELLIVVGNQAPEKASGLLMLLKAEPDVEQRVESASLVGERRWDLRLKSGADVKLPEEDLGLALRRLAIKQETEGLLDKKVLSIDVRESDRITVRALPDAVEKTEEGNDVLHEGSQI